MTISWLKYRILHGLDPKTILGILSDRDLTMSAGRGGRGRRAEDQGSLGPGMRRKREWERREGNFCSRRERRLNSSVEGD